MIPRLARLVALATGPLLLVACASGRAPSASARTTATTVGPPTSVAATTALAPSTTADAATGTTASPTTTALPAGVIAALGALGVTPASPEAQCIAGRVDLPSIDFGAAAPPIGFFRAVVACAPAALSGVLAKSLHDSLPDVAQPKLSCVADGVVSVLPGADDVALAGTITSEPFSSLPAAFQAAILDAVKSCGVPADVLTKAWNET
jgi:hypothetical protein